MPQQKTENLRQLLKNLQISPAQLNLPGFNQSDDRWKALGIEFAEDSEIAFPWDSEAFLLLFPGLSESEALWELGRSASALRLTAAPCAENRSGPLCSMCIPGYVEGLGTACIPCAAAERRADPVVLFALLALLLTVVIALYAWLLKSDRHMRVLVQQEERAKQRFSAGFTEATEAVADSQARTGLEDLSYSRYLPVLNRKTGQPDARPDYLFKLKIVLGFAQIVASLSMDLQISWPPRFKTAVAALAPFNFDFIQLIGSAVGCTVETSYYQRLAVMCAFPPAVCILLFIGYYIPSRAYLHYSHKHSHLRPPNGSGGLGNENLGSSNNKFLYQIQIRLLNVSMIKLMFFSLFLLYPPVSAATLRLYHCQSINGFSLLKHDLSIECYNGQWNDWARILPIFIILYPIGIPILFMGCLYNAYRKRPKGRLGMGNEDNGGLDALKNRLSYGFLYECYSRHYWYWESLDLLHKFILTALLPLNPQPDQQFALAAVFSTCYTILLLLKQPYIRPSDDSLQLLAQIEILMFLTAGHAQKVQPIEQLGENQGKLLDLLLSIFLITALCIVIGLFLLQFCRTLYSRYLNHQARKMIRQEKLAGLGSKLNEIEKRKYELEMAEMRVKEKLARELDDYSEAVPEFDRREWQQARFSGLARLRENRGSDATGLGMEFEMKRNPIWGLEGNDALFDEIADDEVGELFVNPLNSGGRTLYGNYDELFSSGTAVGGAEPFVWTKKLDAVKQAEKRLQRELENQLVSSELQQIEWRKRRAEEFLKRSISMNPQLEAQERLFPIKAVALGATLVNLRQSVSENDDDTGAVPRRESMISGSAISRLSMSHGTPPGEGAASGPTSANGPERNSLASIAPQHTDLIDYSHVPDRISRDSIGMIGEDPRREFDEEIHQAFMAKLQARLMKNADKEEEEKNQTVETITDNQI